MRRGDFVRGHIFQWPKHKSTRRPSRMRQGQSVRLHHRVAIKKTSTQDMVMNVAELIEYASSFYTLEPGDVIVTGTPAGVGYPRKPPG